MSYDTFSLWFDGPAARLGLLEAALLALALIAIALGALASGRARLGDNALWTWHGATPHRGDA